jgi:hypothetical protein
MQVQLIRKLADHLDGIDVSAYSEGDVVELSRREAELLIAEAWAIPYFSSNVRELRHVSARPMLAMAADRLGRRSLEHMRRFRQEMETKRFDEQERRRAEDRIREELHDEHAKTINGEDAASIMRRNA